MRLELVAAITEEVRQSERPNGNARTTGSDGARIAFGYGIEGQPVLPAREPADLFERQRGRVSLFDTRPRRTGNPRVIGN
jgi:hypothetical protein